jgi:hypothetical protein
MKLRRLEANYTSESEIYKLSRYTSSFIIAMSIKCRVNDDSSMIVIIQFKI